VYPRRGSSSKGHFAEGRSPIEPGPRANPGQKGTRQTGQSWRRQWEQRSAAGRRASLLLMALTSANLLTRLQIPCRDGGGPGSYYIQTLIRGVRPLEYQLSFVLLRPLLSKSHHDTVKLRRPARRHWRQTLTAQRPPPDMRGAEHPDRLHSQTLRIPVVRLCSVRQNRHNTVKLRRPATARRPAPDTNSTILQLCPVT
jgi:hypothetical protein